MQALIEIMYYLPDNGTVREKGREVVRPEWWDQWRGRTFLRSLRGKGNEWIDITGLLEESPPKFALVPIEEARSWDVFSEQAQRLIHRNVNLYTWLKQWILGDVSLLEALRGACWANLQTIAAMQETAPFRCEPLSLEAETLEEWLGRAAECSLAYLDVMVRYGRWLELQNPPPIKVDGKTLVYVPPADMESWRQSELAKIEMMHGR